MTARKGACYALSDWECDELRHYHDAGWTVQELAWHYGVSEPTVRRIVNRPVTPETLRADIRHVWRVIE